jgi:hypothetical protein
LTCGDKERSWADLTDPLILATLGARRARLSCGSRAWKHFQAPIRISPLHRSKCVAGPSVGSNVRTWVVGAAEFLEARYPATKDGLRAAMATQKELVASDFVLVDRQQISGHVNVGRSVGKSLLGIGLLRATGFGFVGTSNSPGEVVLTFRRTRPNAIYLPPPSVAAVPRERKEAVVAASARRSSPVRSSELEAEVTRASRSVSELLELAKEASERAQSLHRRDPNSQSSGQTMSAFRDSSTLLAALADAQSTLLAAQDAQVSAFADSFSATATARYAAASHSYASALNGLAHERRLAAEFWASMPTSEALAASSQAGMRLKAAVLACNKAANEFREAHAYMQPQAETNRAP